MPLAPFDELDQAGLRVLGFTIDVTRDGELAFVAGQMQVLLHRSDKSGEDWLTLIITLPNGREPRRGAGLSWFAHRGLAR